MTNFTAKNCEETGGGCGCGLKSPHVADALHARLLELGVPVQKVFCLGADSTVGNTGILVSARINRIFTVFHHLQGVCINCHQ